MAHLLAAVTAADVPSAFSTLTTALTVEGLILAAFAFAVRLSEPAPAGHSPFFAQGYFGWLFVAAISAASVSAGAAWWSAYHPLELHGINHWLRAGGLIPGIIGPPLFAAIINWQARQ